jgi:hypothetical protein
MAEFPIRIPDQDAPDEYSPDLLPDETTQPDLGASLERHELLCRELELKTKEHELQVEKSMLSQRKVYAGSIFLSSAAWLFFIGRVVWCAGCKQVALSDPVLIALITTTTINVLGLFYIVARWLFPHKNTAAGRVPSR